MRANQRAIQSYGDVKVTSGVSSANNVQLIQMLFDGLLESLVAARGHIQHKNLTEKSKSIARASRIVIGLQGALDFEKGGDLANNLNELYSYVTRRLFHVNSSNSQVAPLEAPIRVRPPKHRESRASNHGSRPKRPRRFGH